MRVVHPGANHHLPRGWVDAPRHVVVGGHHSEKYDNPIGE